MERRGSTPNSAPIEPADCDALPDEESCNAAAGDGFQCVWVADVYSVELDGRTCAVGDPVGRCLADFEIETGCADEPGHDCGGGTQIPSVFVREVEGGPTLIFQGGFFSASCGGIPELWISCEGEGEHPACDCACDPGLPG
jgi:hypothetical protein